MVLDALADDCGLEFREKEQYRIASGFMGNERVILLEPLLFMNRSGGPVRQIREFSDLPVAVGFGIKNAEMAVRVARHADAVVIGSALVEALAGAESSNHACAIATAFVAPVRQSLDNMA